MTLENIACQKTFGGWNKRYRHHSTTLDCDMVFSVFLHTADCLRRETASALLALPA
jgi:hypothetical protein